jgi:hypothetical protein
LEQRQSYMRTAQETYMAKQTAILTR